MFLFTYVLIAVTCLVSIPAFSNRDFFYKSMFYPYEIKRNGEWYRFLSHGFVHADGMHLILNMYVLLMFGRIVEDIYRDIFESKGVFFYMLLYIGAIILSSYYSYERNKNNSHYSAVGASGAVSAVVFAMIFFMPAAKLHLFFFFPMPAWIFGFLYLAYSWYMAKKGNDNIGHDAHFWGAVFGLIFTGLLCPDLILTFLDRIKS